MCTIVVLHRVHPEFPVVVAANRDEFLSRPSEGAQVLVDEPRVVGGRDAERGGTWMGASRAGRFVGLTNLRTGVAPDRALRSRGEVVVDALRAGDADAFVRGLDGRAYNPFNLLWGDARGLRVGYARAGVAALEIADVPAGIHVLVHDRLDATGIPKIERARAAAAAVAGQPWPALVDGLRGALALHPDVCIHGLVPAGTGGRLDTAGAGDVYGTRSFSLIALAPGRVAHYLYAPGPPCTTAPEDVTRLVL